MREFQESRRASRFHSKAYLSSDSLCRGGSTIPVLRPLRYLILLVILHVLAAVLHFANEYPPAYSELPSVLNQP